MAFLVTLCNVSVGQTPNKATSPVPGAVIHVTHVLGFEGVRHNVSGNFRIQGDTLQFQRDGDPDAQVNISSIQDIFVEDEDKQVGGMAMTLAKAATPYGGGRVVSLFAHKKYDVLTVEYRDKNGGLHGAIFQLGKGQGQTFKKDLVIDGAHILSQDSQATEQSTPEVKHDNK